ncbi:BrnT family toxin [Rectinema subterraneum]
MTFEWDENKNQINIQKHGVSFEEAKGAFLDMHRIIIVDEKHSRSEKRYFCIGKTRNGIATVRFTIRANNIRIFGAGYWREGKKRYEQENNLY